MHPQALSDFTCEGYFQNAYYSIFVFRNDAVVVVKVIFKTHMSAFLFSEMTRWWLVLHYFLLLLHRHLTSGSVIPAEKISLYHFKLSLPVCRRVVFRFPALTPLPEFTDSTTVFPDLLFHSLFESLSVSLYVHSFQAFDAGVPANELRFARGTASPKIRKKSKTPLRRSAKTAVSVSSVTKKAKKPAVVATANLLTKRGKPGECHRTGFALSAHFRLPFLVSIRHT